jgi:hypothetical protein
MKIACANLINHSSVTGGMMPLCEIESLGRQLPDTQRQHLQQAINLSPRTHGMRLP